MQGNCSIAVVDDDPAVLRGLTRLLGSNGWDVQAFESPQDLLDSIKTLEPGCVIADVAMPGLSGLELQERFTADGCECPMVFITGYADVRASVRAMRGGAVDFLTKPFGATELIDAVERALRRAEQLRIERGELARTRERFASLTQREREVFEQVVAGFLNKQIAANLGISEKTVKVHRARVMRKMYVRSVVSLGRVAEQMGIH